MPPLLSSSDSEDEVPQPTLRINEFYAARLEHNKAREELHRLEAKYGKSLRTEDNGNDEDEDDEETSESEDEVGELVTPELDAEIWRTIAMIREKRPEVYDENFKVFRENVPAPLEKEKKEKPMYLKDYHRRNLLAGDNEAEDEQQPRITTYEQEQTALKEAFHTAISSSSEDEEGEGGLFQPKRKSKKDHSAEEEQYASFLSSTLKDEASKKMLLQLQSLAATAAPVTGTDDADEGEAFLAKYLLNRGWLDPDTARPELYEDASSDEEKAEDFETAYNFRFEAPGGADIVTHARTISSTRRGDEKRKKERERKKVQKEEEKRKEMEEIARLRNLKRMELEERLRKVEGVAGTKGGWTEKDLEGDFDPEEWDKRMQGVFDESYYNDEDKKKPKFEDDIDITDIVPDEEEQEGDDEMDDGNDEGDEAPEENVVTKKLSKREKIDKKRKIEEYLDEHLPLNPSKSSFHYREVSPTSFGLDPLEILTATDSQLNEFVGLKKLAPYRPREVKEGDLRKYGKKKRLREWRKRVQEEGEDEEIRKMLRPEAPKAVEAEKVVEKDGESDGEGGKKKKRKSRKKVAMEV